MTRVLDAAALVLTAAALVAAAIALVATRRPRVALPVLLDLLTAAGLVRLAADPEWHRLLSAAAVIALRHLILLGFSADERSALRVPPWRRTRRGRAGGVAPSG